MVAFVASLIVTAVVVGGILAWRSQALASRRAAAICWAATACGSVAVLVAVGPAGFGHAGGARHLLARLPAEGIPHPIACYRGPASASFYAGRLAANGQVAAIDEPAEVAAFVRANPGAPLVVDARWEELVAAELPAGYGVLRSVTVLPEARELVLFGPTDSPPGGQPGSSSLIGTTASRSLGSSRR